MAERSAAFIGRSAAVLHPRRHRFAHHVAEVADTGARLARLRPDHPRGRLLSTRTGTSHPRLRRPGTGRAPVPMVLKDGVASVRNGAPAISTTDPDQPRDEHWEHTH